MTLREDILHIAKQGVKSPYDIAERTGASVTYICKVMQPKRGFKTVGDNRFDLKVSDIIKADDCTGKGSKFQVIAIYEHIFRCIKISGKHELKVAFTKGEYLCGDVRKAR